MQRETVAQIREKFRKAAHDELPSLVAEYGDDSRSGVSDIVRSAERVLEAQTAEAERLVNLTALQRSLQEDGYTIVAGVDEVGRGALAGPVTAAAVVLPVQARIPGIDDSKKLTPDSRSRLDVEIRSACSCSAVSHVGPDVIDEIGIASATVRAMRSAIEDLSLAPDHVIVDGLPVELGRPSTAVVDGDASVATIAAASILAKVARDRLMTELDAEFPGYGFTVNKGYGTEPHLTAIRALGVSTVHRRSFAPCVDQQSLF